MSKKKISESTTIHIPHRFIDESAPQYAWLHRIAKTWENKELKSRNAYLIGLPPLSMLPSAPSHSAPATYSLVFSYKKATKCPLPPSFREDSSQTLKSKTLNSREISATTNTILSKHLHIIQSCLGAFLRYVWDKALLEGLFWATSVWSLYLSLSKPKVW